MLHGCHNWSCSGLVLGSYTKVGAGSSIKNITGRSSKISQETCWSFFFFFFKLKAFNLKELCWFLPNINMNLAQILWVHKCQSSEASQLSFLVQCSYSSGLSYFQWISSVAQSCATLQPHGLQHGRPPHHHQFLEFTQTHVHWVGDAIQPSHPLSSPAPNLSQHQGLFQWVNSSHEVATVLEFQLQHQYFQ